MDYNYTKDKFEGIPVEEAIAYLKETLQKLESGQFSIQHCELDITTPKQRMLGPDMRYGLSKVHERTVRWDITIYERL